MKRSFGIALPVHNGERYLRLAIESALAQNRPADQIVVVDDASTDRTAEVLAAFRSTGIAIHQLTERVPAPAAWNEAIQRTSTEFFVVLAHDDLLHADFLSQAERAISKYPDIDLFICGSMLIDAEGQPRGTWDLPREEFGLPGLIANEAYLDKFTRDPQFFLPTGTLIRRSMFDRLGGFDPLIRVAYDWEFFLRAGTIAKIYGCDGNFVDYRIHGSQSIAGHRLADNGDSDVIFSKLPIIAAELNARQRRWLLENMCDFLRRFVTWPVADPAQPVEQIIQHRRQVAAKLDQWRHSSSPYARYVRTNPTHWKQWLMWNAGRNAAGIHVTRALLRAFEVFVIATLETGWRAKS